MRLAILSTMYVVGLLSLVAVVIFSSTHLSTGVATPPCTNAPAPSKLSPLIAVTPEPSPNVRQSPLRSATSEGSSPSVGQFANDDDEDLPAGLFAAIQRRLEAAVVASTAERSGRQIQQQQQQINSQSPTDGKSLVSRLGDVLARYGLRLPVGLLTPALEPDAICLHENADRIRYYCNALTDGNYFDPWNPWCGYVECRNNEAVRKTCSRGRWMGYAMNSDGSLMTQTDMCRIALPVFKNGSGRPSSGACSERTMQLDLCRQAEDANSVIPFVDPAEDLQTSLSELFLKWDTDQQK